MLPSNGHRRRPEQRRQKQIRRARLGFYPRFCQRFYPHFGGNRLIEALGDGWQHELDEAAAVAGSVRPGELRVVVLLAAVEDRALDRLLRAVGLLLLDRLKFVQALDEQQVGHLLDDLSAIGYPAAPERVPDVVDLGLDAACDHAAPLPSSQAHAAGAARYSPVVVTFA